MPMPSNPILALVQRDLVADMREYKVTIARYLFQPAVFIFVFGYVLGGFFAMPNGSYSEVVVPGIIAITVMSTSFSSVGGAIITGYYFRSMEGWLLSPVGLRALMTARVLSGLLYGTLSGLVVASISWAILGVSPKSLLALILLISVGSLFFSFFTVALFLIPEKPDKGQEIFSFLMMPMTFFGCTFYSYSMLKPPVNYIALIFPTTYLSEGLRAAYSPDMPHIDSGLIFIGLIIALGMLYFIADWAFQRRLKDFLW